MSKVTFPETSSGPTNTKRGCWVLFADQRIVSARFRSSCIDTSLAFGLPPIVSAVSQPRKYGSAANVGVEVATLVGKNPLPCTEQDRPPSLSSLNDACERYEPGYCHCSRPSKS